MDFSEKISTILKTNTLQLVTKEDLAEYCGFHRDTIRKAIDRKSELKDKYLRIFQDKLRINPQWWDTGKGDIYVSKPTQDLKPNGNKEKMAPEEIYRNLVESNSEYRLIPKIILDQYEIIPKRELEERAEIVRIAIAAKNDVIAELKKEISDLRAKEVAMPAKQT